MQGSLPCFSRSRSVYSVSGPRFAVSLMVKNCGVFILLFSFPRGLIALPNSAPELRRIFRGFWSSILCCIRRILVFVPGFFVLDYCAVYSSCRCSCTRGARLSALGSYLCNSYYFLLFCVFLLCIFPKICGMNFLCCNRGLCCAIIIMQF